MSKWKHMEAQMIGALMQLEARSQAEDVARDMDATKHMICAGKAKCGGMDVSKV